VTSPLSLLPQLSYTDSFVFCPQDPSRLRQGFGRLRLLGSAGSRASSKDRSGSAGSCELWQIQDVAPRPTDLTLTVQPELAADMVAKALAELSLPDLPVSLQTDQFDWIG